MNDTASTAVDTVLSICIPTYNRASMLEVLLGRIADDLTGDITDRVEVVVTDNESPDETPAVVERFRARIARLRYVRHPVNIGPDRNFRACVAEASSEFCWLMGDDDLPEPGSIARIVEVVQDHPEICGLSMDRFARSRDLQTRLSEDVFSQFDCTTVLHGAEDVFENIVDYICYLSAQVVRRSIWQDVVRECPVDQFYNSYVHVYVIAQMLRRNPSWLVLKERLVTWRADNDSFLSAGRYRRIEIDVTGFAQIAQACFGQRSDTYRAIRDRIATRNLRMMITSSRVEGSWNADLRRKTVKLALKHYARSMPFWMVTAPILFAPSAVLPVLKYAQRVVHERRARRIGMVSDTH